MFWDKSKFTEQDMAASWIAGFTSAIQSENLEKLRHKIKDEAIIETIKGLGKDANASNKK